MIDIQRRVKDMMKIAAEANTTITEMEEVILEANINNQVINAMNITEVSEDLRYLVQSNIYMDDNIQEIQDLYKEKEVKREEGRIKNKEVILIKPYKISKTTSTSSSAQTSFITDEVKNLTKYIKFIQAPMQTRISGCHHTTKPSNPEANKTLNFSKKSQPL